MSREERNEKTPRFFIVLVGFMRILAILQTKSVGILLVSDRVPVIIIYPCLIFRKLELRHSVISFIQQKLYQLEWRDQGYS